MSKQAITPPRKPRFWDNLIPLRADTSGHQLAGWEPGPPVMKGLGCAVLADQRIPVDGAVLAADVFLPKQEGRYPAIVVFGAYSKELHSAGAPTGSNEVGCPPVFTDRGYAHVIVTRRSMGQSTGEEAITCNEVEIDDHEAAIAWASQQPWCDGRVVMFGTSYYGMVQPQVAVRRPPALKAFVANELCTDFFRHIVMYGGTPNNFFLSLWLGANFNPFIVKLRVPPLVRALISQILNSRFKRVWVPALTKRTNRIMLSFMEKTPTLAARKWYVNWLIDGKTRSTNHMPPGPSDRLAEIDIPFVAIQNLAMWNLHQFGSYDLWQNSSTPHNRKWMILGKASYVLPVYEWQLEALAFFDHVLHGADNGYAQQAPVRYWLDGADRYEAASDFPVPSARAWRLYPASAGDDTTTHSLSPSIAQNGSNSWAAVPLRAQTVGGFDKVINHTLCYELPVEESIQLAGPVSAHLVFSCNEIDSYVVARLSRVDKAGTLHLLSMGAMRPVTRKIDPARSTACEIVHDLDVTEPLVPGVPVELAFSLTPAPVLLHRGDRLRLDICSRSDLLRSDQSHDHAHFDLQVPPYFSRNTLHYGDQCYIEVHRL